MRYRIVPEEIEYLSRGHGESVWIERYTRYNVFLGNELITFFTRKQWAKDFVKNNT